MKAHDRSTLLMKPQRRESRVKHFSLPLCALLALLLSGCTTIDELKSTKQYTPKQQREGSVNVASRATGLNDNKVGNTTILSLPVGRIKAQGDTRANIMKSVGVALSAAGYNAEDASFNSEDAGYVYAHIERIAFGNFLFSTWGTIIVQLRLETRDGELLWDKRIRTSVNAVNNYDRTAVFAMNRLVKEMTLSFVQEDFYSATQRVKRHSTFLEENTPLSSN